MEFSPKAAELTTLLESRMTNFYTNFQVDEIGRVVSVGDGIARVYGLNEIQAGEMVEFASGVKGIALNPSSWLTGETGPLDWGHNSKGMPAS